MEVYARDLEQWKRNCEQSARDIEPPVVYSECLEDLMFEPLELPEFEDEPPSPSPPSPKKARRRRGVNKCPQAVSMEGAIIHHVIDLSVIPVIPRYRPKQKIESSENHANTVLMRKREFELRRLGRWDAYFRTMPEAPVRHVFKPLGPVDREEAKRFILATRVATDVYIKQLFAYNKQECARMGQFLHNV